MASRALLLCVVLAVVAGSEARDFIVGGYDGWKVPAQSDALNKWAQVNRFHVGDKLVFKFNGAADSVLQVTKDDYDRCGTASPIAAYKTGDAAVPLTRSGAYFFVSGAPGSCDKGERLIVVVMSEKHSRPSNSAPVVAAPVPAHSPLAASPFDGPAAAPALAPATGAAGRTAAAGSLLLGAVLGGLLVGF